MEIWYSYIDNKTGYEHNVKLRREACLKYSLHGVNEFESTNLRMSRIGNE